MNILLPYVTDHPFSDHAITLQLKRIFMHPDFSKSEILKKFLTYIVKETLTGNADILKEYTIALNVLKKPSNFNPQKNCIVRIHAGRLRQALCNYYTQTGSIDSIIIDIPKGKYVPVFMDRQQWLEEKTAARPPSEAISYLHNNLEQVTFAVLPFICTSDDKLVRSFSDSLCLQICSSLSQVSQVSVIAYQAIKNLAAKYLDIKELGAQVGFNHVITGGTQYVKRQIRINIQMIDSRNYKQIWSKIFECRMTTTNLFDIQDEICQYAIAQAEAIVK